MKTKLIIGILSALLVSGLLWYSNYLLKENGRLKRNETTLLKDHKAETSSLILSKEALEVKLENDSSLYSVVIDSLNLKVKQIESITVSNSKAKIQFIEVLKDTTIFQTDTVIVYKYFEYDNDPWLYAEGKVFEDSIEIKAELPDTIYCVNYWEREGKFLPKIFGKKQPHSNIENSNPYVFIQVEQSIRQR